MSRLYYYFRFRPLLSLFLMVVLTISLINAAIIIQKNRFPHYAVTTATETNGEIVVTAPTEPDREKGDASEFQTIELSEEKMIVTNLVSDENQKTPMMTLAAKESDSNETIDADVMSNPIAEKETEVEMNLTDDSPALDDVAVVENTLSENENEFVFDSESAVKTDTDKITEAEPIEEWKMNEKTASEPTEEVAATNKTTTEPEGIGALSDSSVAEASDEIDLNEMDLDETVAVRIDDAHETESDEESDVDFFDIVVAKADPFENEPTNSEEDANDLHWKGIDEDQNHYVTPKLHSKVADFYAQDDAITLTEETPDETTSENATDSSEKAPVAEAAPVETPVAETGTSDEAITEAPVPEAPVAEAVPVETPVAETPVAEAAPTETSVVETVTSDETITEAPVPETEPSDVVIEEAPIPEALTAKVTSAANEIWVVSSESVQKIGVGASALSYWKAEGGQFQPSDAKQFLATQTPAAATVILIHGNMTDWDVAMEQTTVLMGRLQQIQQNQANPTPFRLVIWKWASERQYQRIRTDSQVKAYLADLNGFYLASLLAALNSENDVTMIGFSFGARTIGSAMTLLAGGSIFNHTLPPEMISDAGHNRYNAILLAGACNYGDFGVGGPYATGTALLSSVINVFNPTDQALKFYPLLYGAGGPDALGIAPIQPATVPASLRGRLWSINSSVNGPKHNFNNLFYSINPSLLGNVVFDLPPMTK